MEEVGGTPSWTSNLKLNRQHTQMRERERERERKGERLRAHVAKQENDLAKKCD